MNSAPHQDEKEKRGNPRSPGERQEKGGSDFALKICVNALGTQWRGKFVETAATKAKEGRKKANIVSGKKKGQIQKTKEEDRSYLKQ